MPGEFYFMAMAGLGVSLAGFAGLISALGRSPASHSAVAAYRITGIVFLGFSLTFIGFGTVALYAVTGQDITLTVRLASLLVCLPHLWGIRAARPGPHWPNETERRIQIGVLSVLILATLANVVVASVGYLEVLLLFILFGPVSIFYNTVRDAAAGEPAEDPPSTGP